VTYYEISVFNGLETHKIKARYSTMLELSEKLEEKNEYNENV